MKVTSQPSIGKSALFLVLLCFSFSLIAPTEESVLINENDPDLQWGPCPEFMPEGCQIAVLNGDPAEWNADICVLFIAFEEPVDAFAVSERN